MKTGIFHFYKFNLLTLRIDELPKDFSYALTFFCGVAREKKEICKELKNVGAIKCHCYTPEEEIRFKRYLSAALEYLNNNPFPKFNGILIQSPFLELINCFSKLGKTEVMFSMAGAIFNKIDFEIDCVNKQRDLCDKFQTFISNNEDFNSFFEILKIAESEEIAIKQLCSQLNISMDFARYLVECPLSELEGKRILYKKKSLDYLLSYLEFLKSVK